MWFTPVLPPQGAAVYDQRPIMSYLPYNYPKSMRYSFEYKPADGRGKPASVSMQVRFWTACVYAPQQPVLQPIFLFLYWFLVSGGLGSRQGVLLKR